jgi:hypothetical protein
VRLPHGEAASLVLVALVWAIVLPLLHGFARLYAARPM